VTGDLALSRPLRLATQITGASPDETRFRLDNAMVYVQIAGKFTRTPDAAILLRSLVDQLSRFCGTVIVSAPAGIAQTCLDRDRELHHTPRVRVGRRPVSGSVIDVVVGDTTGVPGGIVTCSDGWVGKVRSLDTHQLTTAFTAANPIGALTAAALTAGEVFLRLVGVDCPSHAFELSAWTGESGPPDSLPTGPNLPTIPTIDALLIGCGNVMNGWVAAARALQIAGHVRAVDRQSLGEENFGPYALARRDMIGQPKTALLAKSLQPHITVTPHDEDLDLFAPRVTRWQLPLPGLVITGLDDVEPRHVVQRLWPDVLVDMAAGGTTSQVVVYRRGDAGQCLLGAFTAFEAEPAYVRRVEALTGLRAERFLTDFTTPITSEDVAQAPREHRARLQAAADAGQLVCGFINQASLTTTSTDDDFAPAAPFVSALTGARAAAITVALLVGDDVPGGLHWQYNFLSSRARTAIMRCLDTCECRRHEQAS
jgi:hypothetical protein